MLLLADMTLFMARHLLNNTHPRKHALPECFPSSRHSPCTHTHTHYKLTQEGLQWVVPCLPPL